MFSLEEVMPEMQLGKRRQRSDLPWQARDDIGSQI